MLYLSLILIASGIFFIFYTLISRTTKETGISDLVKGHSTNVSESISIPISEEKSKAGVDNKINISHEPAATADIKPEITSNDLLEDTKKDVDSKIDDRDKDTGSDDISNVSQVVLYEDSSKIIDYDNNDSIIDTTLHEYKKIRRIGEGNIEFLEDCINFRTEKKLFRFDLHRVVDIKNGSNYFALWMKGSDISRLFVFRKDSLISNKLKQFYNKISSNSS